MLAYICKLDDTGQERCGTDWNSVTKAYTTDRGIRRHIRRWKSPGTYRVYIHCNEDRRYGKADRSWTLTIPRTLHTIQTPQPA